MKYMAVIPESLLFSVASVCSVRNSSLDNRGCLHRADRQLTSKRWARKQWVICELSFRGRHRALMAPGSYTELFFLDEATALAAGHRPCGTCRKEAFHDFVSGWRSLNPASGSELSALDETLHSQRAAVIGKDSLLLTDLASIPDGCMITLGRDDDPYLVFQRRLLRWSFNGYIPGPEIAQNAQVFLITPPAIREIIARGYSPQLHPSVFGKYPVQPTSKYPERELDTKRSSLPSRPMVRTGPKTVTGPVSASVVSSRQLHKLVVTPKGKELYAYFAAILQVTGMDRGESFPLKKFLGNFSGHENAGRIVKTDSGNFRLSETGIRYFRDRLQPGNPQHVTQEEVDRFKQGILRSGGKGWSQID